ncbi:hypothetical protein [Neobacillus soli]|uniref:hypothetical protein n=1 Tax=Neobacillus soli TaxID=220688 RepID=UPI0008261A81|nr:hypothetical protein [Neobacillus soli]
MNLMKLNIRQSIFVIFLIIILLPLLGYFVTIYTGSTVYIPFIAIAISLVGCLIATTYKGQKRLIRDNENRGAEKV